MSDDGTVYGPQPLYGPQQVAVAPTSTDDFSVPDNFDMSGSGYSSAYTPVVPDTTSLNLPGQLPGIPGGGASNGGVGASDPSGINMVHTDPKVNPTQTGGFMQALAQIAAAGSQSFTTFVKGSPSVGIPGAKTPVSGGIGGAFSLTTATGATNWTTIAIIVGVLGVGAFLVVKYA